MAIAALRHRITLKPLVRRPDERHTQWIEEWPEEQWEKVWAAFQPILAREAARYSQMQNNWQARVIIRHHPRLTGRWLVGFRGKDYEIESVTDADAAGQMLELMVTERIE